MIILNNKYFGKFGMRGQDSPEPVAGLYKVNKKSITLYDLGGNKCGVIANGVLASAKQLESGKWWYTYMTPRVVGDYDNYTHQRDDIRRAMKILEV
jgi:hypothetical protein